MGSLPFTSFCTKTRHWKRARPLVAAHGGIVTGQAAGIRMLMVELPQAQVEALAAEEAVQWVEPAAPPLTGTNDGSRAQIGVNTLQAAPYNLDGTNVDILVYDSGQAGDHTDFGSRLIHGDADTVSDHSTHVAGTVGGSGANSVAQGGWTLQWRGMAPNADLISYGTNYPGTGVIFYANVPDIEADWAQAQNTYGADLGTASLGSNVYQNYPSQCDSLLGRYGAASVLIDQIVRGGNSTVGLGDKYITTWAVGNERGSAYPYCGDSYGTITPPSAAKNPIHVGGSNTNNNTQYLHTSWGPTEDGRLKPIVTAGACQTTGDLGITSTDNNPLNAYTTMCGTSMATPAVAGGIALMLQHYRSIYSTSGQFWPSTAKAILMQTATDLGNPGPDYQWGYGLVNIRAAVDLISRKAFRQDNVGAGQVDLFP
jgi:subtilisin family serine protease